MNTSSIKWSNITDNFEAGFKVAFSSDKKAHFDNLPEEYRVIDGAKGTWCNLLLLDAMIYILVNDSFNSSSRRAFNQHRVLCECVLTELRSISYEAYVEITDEKNNAVQKNAPVPEYLSRDLSQKYEHLTAHEYLEAPWDTMDSMRLSLIEGPPSKAKNKFCAIVDMLTNHTALSQFDFDFDHIIQTVISRALFVFKNHKVSLAPLISMYQMPSALTLNSSLLMTHEMLSMKRSVSVSKVTPTNKQKRTPTNKDLVVKSEIFPTADSSSNRKKTKAQLIFPVATQPVESADHSYMQACVPVQLAASLLPVMTGDLSDISDYDFDFLMNYIDGDEAVSPRPANTVETAEEHQAAAAKAKHIAEQLNRLKSKKVLKKVLKAQKESAPSVSIVIQKTDAQHLCAIIPVLPLKLLDTIETSSQDDSDSLASFGADDFEFFNDDAYALPNSFSPDGEEQESIGSTSQDSAAKITPTHTGKVTPTHAMTSLSISLPSSVARDDAVKEKKKQRPPYVRKTSGTSGSKAPQSSVLIAIDPATTKYVLKDNVLCAIVPVLDPAMIAAHAAAIASEQSRKQQSLQISDADLEMLMGGCGGDDYSEGGTDGAATSGSDTCGSKSSQFSDQSPPPLSMSLPCPPETWSGVSLSSMQTASSGGANLRPFLLPPPMKMNRLNSLALETPLTFTDTNACISMATFELLSSLNPNQFMNFE